MTRDTISSSKEFSNTSNSRIVAAFCSNTSVQVTGGDRYNKHLLDAWAKLLPVTYAPVRYRWFLLRCYAAGFLITHLKALRQAEFLFQAATSIYSSALLIRLCRKLFPKIKHIGAAHHPRWLEEPALLAWERDFLNSFDYLIAISEHVRSEMVREGVHRPIYLLLPGKASILQITSPKADPPVILWNGYLLPRKGAWLLLGALGHLSSGKWRAHFIVSDRISKDLDMQFNQKLEELGSERRERIRVSDRLPIHEFREQFFQASIFCLPSLVEGYSISTAEAMSCGCAVVVPRTDNFLELLGTSEYAGFYDPEDPDDLTRKLDLLLANANLLEAAKVYCFGRSAQLPTWEDFKVNAEGVLRQITRSEDSLKNASQR